MGHVTTTDQRLTHAIAKNLENELQDEFADRYQDVFVVDVLDPAKEINPKDSKGTIKNAVIGFAIAFVLSVAGVWIYAALDVTVRDKKKLEDHFDIPVIGLIPAASSNTSEKEA